MKLKNNTKMIKKVFILSSLLFLFSCKEKGKEVKYQECRVISCKSLKEIVSVHDEINRDKQKWEVRTSCGTGFISQYPYEVGDTVGIVIENKIY